jgi:two-component system sensor kinase FixL
MGWNASELVIPSEPRGGARTTAPLDEVLALYRGVIDAAVDGIIIIDGTGTIETFNAAAEHIFEWPADAVVGRNVSILMPDPDASRHNGYIANYLAGNPAQIIGIGREVWGRRQSGETFPMELAVGEIPTLAPRRFVGIVRDISARRAMQAQLTAREAELRLLFENAPIGMFSCRRDGCFATVNPALVQLLGRAPDELLGTSCATLCRIDEQARFALYLAALTEGEDAVAINLHWRRADGAELSIELRATAVGEFDAGDIIIGQVIDHSERVRLERESRDTRERLAHVGRVTTLGEMASAIAHEINQPLAAITAAAHAAERWLTQPADNFELVSESLQMVTSQALRAADVVRRIRAFVSHHDSARARVDLNDIVTGVLELAAIDAGAHAITVTTVLAPTLPAVLIDAVQIQQVCLNLIRNAVDAMVGQAPTRRRLTITTRRAGDEVCALFSDCGPGVAPDMRERLFQPFQTTKTDGMGMGLSLSQSLVAAHGGSLRYESNVEGGATFVIALPAVPG